MSSAKRPNVLVFLILVLIVAPFSAAAQTLSPNQQFARDIYKELVEINTVTPTGDTAKAAEAMAARLRAAGYAGPLAIGQDMTFVEIGDTVSVLPCPSASNPTITSVTNGSYQTKISAGDTVIDITMETRDAAHAEITPDTTTWIRNDTEPHQEGGRR